MVVMYVNFHRCRIPIGYQLTGLPTGIFRRFRRCPNIPGMCHRRTPTGRLVYGTQFLVLASLASRHLHVDTRGVGDSFRQTEQQNIHHKCCRRDYLCTIVRPSRNKCGVPFHHKCTPSRHLHKIRSSHLHFPVFQGFHSRSMLHRN